MKKEEKLEEYEIIEEHDNHTIYVGYTPRLILGIFLFIICSILSVYLMYKAFMVNDLENTRYEEIGKSTYQVYDRDSNVLGTTQDAVMQSSQIDKIDLEILYNMNLSEKSNIHYEYEVVGELKIIEKDNEDKIFYQESYSLTDKREETIQEEKNFTAKESVQIGYQEYEEIAKKYRESYGVETNSYLEVFLKVNYQSEKNNSYPLEGESNTGIKIPIGEETISIQEKDVLTDKRINQKPMVQLKSPGLLGLGMLSGVGAVVAFTQLVILILVTVDEESIYDQEVSRILKKNKDKIEVTKRSPVKRGKNLYKVDSFKELKKVHKLTKSPIHYHVITEHQKCEFFILKEKDLYLYTLKSVDLE
ncbi:MAG: hypothetical protein J6X28_02575 [Bacilli bacterium]|nr:hypothetical protein [Bacilli bacterium]